MRTLHDIITEKLIKAFAPTLFELIDETHKHQKHKQFHTEKSHFNLRIASEKLNTLSTIQAHQEIYACLGELMHTHIHALSIHVDRTKRT